MPSPEEIAKRAAEEFYRVAPTTITELSSLIQRAMEEATKGLRAQLAEKEAALEGLWPREPNTLPPDAAWERAAQYWKFNWDHAGRKLASFRDAYRAIAEALGTSVGDTCDEDIADRIERMKAELERYRASHEAAASLPPGRAFTEFGGNIAGRVYTLQRKHAELERRQKLWTELSCAISNRSTQAIREKYKGNTPEWINGETDELTAIFVELERTNEALARSTDAGIAVCDDLNRVRGERDEARKRVKYWESFRGQVLELTGKAAALEQARAKDREAAQAVVSNWRRDLELAAQGDGRGEELLESAIEALAARLEKSDG